MHHSSHPLLTALAFLAALAVCCTEDGPENPTGPDGSNHAIAIPDSSLVITYSVACEWGSDLHLIIDGADTELFPGDTVIRQSPALNRSASQLVYLTSGDVMCAVMGCGQSTELTIADLTSGTEAVLLEAREGVELRDPEWLDDQTIAVFREDTTGLSLLLMTADGTIRNAIALGDVPAYRAKILRAPSPGYRALFVGWRDTTAVLFPDGTVSGKQGGFLRLAGGPIVHGDTVLLQNGYGTPSYRMYGTDGAYLGDTAFSVSLTYEGEAHAHLDSAYIAWMDSSRMIVYRRPNDTIPGAFGHQLYLCDRTGGIKGHAIVAQPEYFLPYFDGESMFYVSEYFGDDAYAVVRQELYPKLEGNGYELLNTVRDDHFITSNNISLYAPH